MTRITSQTVSSLFNRSISEPNPLTGTKGKRPRARSKAICDLLRTPTQAQGADAYAELEGCGVTPFVEVDGELIEVDEDRAHGWMARYRQAVGRIGLWTAMAAVQGLGQWCRLKPASSPAAAPSPPTEAAAPSTQSSESALSTAQAGPFTERSDGKS